MIPLKSTDVIVSVNLYLSLLIIDKDLSDLLMISWLPNLSEKVFGKIGSFQFTSAYNVSRYILLTSLSTIDLIGKTIIWNDINTF